MSSLARRKQGAARTGWWVNALLLIALLLVPLVLTMLGKTFWLGIFTRLIILAIAASSLYLLLGVAGLASFGHAAFLGLGAYAVGIPQYHALYGGADWLASSNGWWHLSIAVGVCAVFALITGAISLRTRGVHFIMITMAFGQMVFYALVSLEYYGGDDGLSVDLLSEFGPIDLENPLHLFFVCYGVLLICLFVLHRLTVSRFGQVLDAASQNETRTIALGINPYGYRLLAYVIAGIMAGVAGVLMANQAGFVSPSIVEWTRSGELMFMIILGGAASLFGPVLGAALFILLEFVLSRWTIYWHLPFGLILLAVVLSGRGGVLGWVNDRFAFASKTGPRP